VNSRLLKWQLSACGLLSVVLAVEWRLGVMAQEDLAAMLNRKLASEYDTSELPALKLPQRSAENYLAVIERPLFLEGRKPLPPEPDPQDAPQAAETGEIDDWQLIGIYQTKIRKYALFRKQNEAKKFVKLYENQAISGWQLQNIQSDRVILQQNEQQKSLMLRKPRPQLPAAQPPKKNAPAPAPGKPPVPARTPPPENKDDET